MYGNRFLSIWDVVKGRHWETGFEKKRKMMFVKGVVGVDAEKKGKNSLEMPNF